MKKHALAVAVLSFALGWLLFQSTERAATQSAVSSARAPVATRAPERRSGAAQTRARAAEVRAPALQDGDLPRSLQGSQIPDLTLDSAGELVVDLRLRRVFDYFLSALGELPLADLRALIVRHLRARLSGASADQSVDILDDYLELERARTARGERAPVRSAGELRERIHEQHALRHELLGDDVADAFFASDERRDQLALARMRGHDDGLSESAIEARVATLMTPEERSAREQTFVISRLRDARAAGQGEAFLQTLTPEARTRLTELEAQHADFRARRESYERARAALDHPSEQQLWETAQRMGFDAHEFARLRMLDGSQGSDLSAR